jgi:hypothetical protein
VKPNFAFVWVRIWVGISAADEVLGAVLLHSLSDMKVDALQRFYFSS